MVVREYSVRPLPDAFNRVVERNYPYYLRFAAQRFRPDQEDVVQDALGYFWRYISRVGMPSDEDTFQKLIFNKIRQSGIDFCRLRSKRKEVLFTSLLDRLSEYDIAEMADDTLIDPARLCESADIYSVYFDVAFDILRDLKPSRRLTILLYLNGKSYREIQCEQPDILMGTLRWCINDFRHKLSGRFRERVPI